MYAQYLRFLPVAALRFTFYALRFLPVPAKAITFFRKNKVNIYTLEDSVIYWMLNVVDAYNTVWMFIAPCL